MDEAMSPGEVADMLGVHRNSVTTRLKKWGIPKNIDHYGKPGWSLDADIVNRLADHFAQSSHTSHTSGGGATGESMSATVADLTDRLIDAERRASDAERRADLAELRLQVARDQADVDRQSFEREQQRLEVELVAVQEQRSTYRNALGDALLNIVNGEALADEIRLRRSRPPDR